MFTVTDELAGVKSVVIDGVDKTHFEGQYLINGDNAEHKVVVTDNAGNVTEYKVTVNKNYTVTYKADGESFLPKPLDTARMQTFPLFLQRTDTLANGMETARTSPVIQQLRWFTRKFLL